jgi:hypothetical protein
MDLLTRFNMVDCKPCGTPFQSRVKLTKTCWTLAFDATLYRKLVGNLIYLTHSRPDISFVVSVVSWFMQDPIESHWKVVKFIVRYMKGTTQFGIRYCCSSDSLVGFTDLTGLVMKMIVRPLLGICFAIALDLWCGRARNIR